MLECRMLNKGEIFLSYPEIDMFKYENELLNKGYKYIVGTDEAGRGPMAGPLVVAAVILPVDKKIDGLNDSKKLSSKQREILFDDIIKNAIEYSIEFIDVEDVDNLNVYQASKIGMINCIKKLKAPVDYILSDAIPLGIDIPCMDIIKGDAQSSSIAAASILAKVSRDRYMCEIASKYPKYGFEKHKGYVTKHHLEMLELHGPCEIHRRSFEPVRKSLYRQTKLDI